MMTIKVYDRPDKPFEVEDRVFHEIFGEGSVEEIKLASNSQYYYVNVVFEEPHQTRPTEASTRFRYLVSSYLSKVAAVKPEDIELVGEEKASGSIDD